MLTAVRVEAGPRDSLVYGVLNLPGPQSYDAAWAEVAHPGKGTTLIPCPFSVTTIMVRQHVLHSQ